jgi:hypothetical protein
LRRDIPKSKQPTFSLLVSLGLPSFAHVVAHRPSGIVGLDMVLVMNQGRMQAFGPKDEGLAKVLRAVVPTPAPLKIIPELRKAGS